MSWERHVKTSPNTENSDNTISSLARGEEVTIIGKTAYGYLTKTSHSKNGPRTLKTQ